MACSAPSANRIKKWIVEYDNGQSVIVPGSHPAQVHYYIKTFWPERNIKLVKEIGEDA